MLTESAIRGKELFYSTRRQDIDDGIQETGEAAHAEHLRPSPSNLELKSELRFRKVNMSLLICYGEDWVYEEQGRWLDAYFGLTHEK